MSVFDILIFLFVLGVLIFVHEMGHFLAAKACGVYVDQFSLGMPPRLFGFTWGETDYCVGLLPIGGFVKMAGQEDVPKTDEERESAYGHIPPERWFNNRPRWQRATVLVAGPLMNLLLGFVIYSAMAAFGGEVPLSRVDSRVGAIHPSSPASSAPMYLAHRQDNTVDFSGPPDAVGWKTGDRIVSINGKSVSRIHDVAIEAVLGAGKEAKVELERIGPDGESLRYISMVEPKVIDDSDLTRFGIMPFDTALIGYVLPDTPAKSTGLQVNDIILHANGKLVDAASFTELVKATPSGTDIPLEVERNGQIVKITLRTQGEGRFAGIQFTPPLQLHVMLQLGSKSPPTIRATDEQFAKKTGLWEGDVIKTVQGEPLRPQSLKAIMADVSYDGPLTVVVERETKLFGLIQEGGVHTLEVTLGQLLQGLTGYDEDERPQIAYISEKATKETDLRRMDIILEIDGQPATAALLREITRTRIGDEISVKVNRPEIGYGIMRDSETFDTTLRVSEVQMIGVVWGTKTVFRRSELSQVLPEAARQCYRVTTQVGTTLAMLFTGGLSPKLLGGPVMIYEVTTQAARTSIYVFLDIVAMISINLCLFNLLPLPILDGGQLFFLGIETIRRKPVSVRVLETVQQLGLLFILGLFVYVTYNDISRLVTGLIP